MKKKRLLAFALSFAMLFGNTTGAYAAETVGASGNAQYTEYATETADPNGDNADVPDELAEEAPEEGSGADFVPTDTEEQDASDGDEGGSSDESPEASTEESGDGQSGSSVEDASSDVPTGEDENDGMNTGDFSEEESTEEGTVTEEETAAEEETATEETTAEEMTETEETVTVVETVEEEVRKKDRQAVTPADSLPADNLDYTWTADDGSSVDSANHEKNFVKVLLFLPVESESEILQMLYQMPIFYSGTYTDVIVLDTAGAGQAAVAAAHKAAHESAMGDDTFDGITFVYGEEAQNAYEDYRAYVNMAEETPCGFLINENNELYAFRKLSSGGDKALFLGNIKEKTVEVLESERVGVPQNVRISGNLPGEIILKWNLVEGSSDRYGLWLYEGGNWKYQGECGEGDGHSEIVGNQFIYTDTVEVEADGKNPVKTYAVSAQDPYGVNGARSASVTNEGFPDGSDRIPAVNLNFSWTADDGSTVDSSNYQENHAKALFFFDVKERSDLIEKIYQQSLFYSVQPGYLDTIVLDTGNAGKEEVAAIHEKAASGKASDNVTFCYETGDYAIQSAYEQYRAMLGTDLEDAYFFLIDEDNIVRYAEYDSLYEQSNVVWQCGYRAKNILQSDFAPPQNIRVTQNSNGIIELTWDFVNRFAFDIDIYRDAECTDLVTTRQFWVANQFPETFSWQHSVEVDADGKNPVYYYVVHSEDWYGILGPGSEVVTNKDVYLPVDGEGVFVYEEGKDENLLAGFQDFTGVKEFLQEYSGREGKESTRFVLDVTGDMTISGDELDLPAAIAYCALHLNGHTLNVAQDATIRVNVSGGPTEDGQNGRILAAENVRLCLAPTLPQEEQRIDAWYSDLSIGFTNGKGTLVLGEKSRDGSALVKNGVFFDRVDFREVSEVRMSGTVSIEGDLTAGILTVDNACDEDAQIYQGSNISGTVRAENLQHNAGFLEVTDITVSGQVTACAGTHMRVYSKAVLGDVSVSEGNEAWECWEIGLAKKQGSAAFGTVTFNGAVSKASESMENAVSIHKAIIAAGGEEQWQSFAAGETLATVMGTEKQVSAKDFRANTQEANDLYVIRQGNELKTAEAVVQVDRNKADGSYAAEYFQTLQEAKAFLEDKAAQAGEEETAYRIMLHKDLTLAGDELDIPSGIQSCNVDLGGHTLTVENDSVIRADMWGGELDGVRGTIKVAKNKTLRFAPAGAIGEITFVDGLSIQFDAASTAGGLILGEVTEGNAYVMAGGVHMHEVSIGKAANVKLYGEAYIGADLTVSQELYVENHSDESRDIWQYANLGGNVTANTACFNGAFGINNLKVTGKSTVQAGSNADIHESAVFGDVEVVNPADEWDVFSINYEKVLNGDSDEVISTTRPIQFGGKLTKDAAANQAVSIHRNILRQYEIVNEGGDTELRTENVGWDALQIGETVATVTAAAVVPVAYIRLDMGEGDDRELSVYRTGTELKVGGVAVRVSYEGDEAQEGKWISYSYTSLEEAAENLAADFGSREGTYQFELQTDTSLTKNLTIPAFVKEMRICVNVKADDSREQRRVASLDFAGFTLTANSLVLQKGARFVNSGAKNGKLVLNAAPEGEQQAFSMDTWEDENRVTEYLDAAGNPVDSENVCHIMEGVDLSAPNGMVWLYTEQEEQFFYMDGAVNVKYLSVERGKWKFGTVTAGNFYVNDTDLEAETVVEAGTVNVGEGATFFPNGICRAETINLTGGGMSVSGWLQADVINVTKAYSRQTSWGETIYNGGKLQAGEMKMGAGILQNAPGGLIICDSYNQTSAASTRLREGSVFVVNRKAVLYNVGVYGYSDEASFYQMRDSEVAFEGSFSVNGELAYLKYGIIDTGLGSADALQLDCEKRSVVNVEGISFYTFDEYGCEGEVRLRDSLPKMSIPARSRLFTTKIKAFPVDAIQIDQPEGENESYTRAFQEDQEVLVGGDWITIKARGVNGSESEQVLKKFVKWSEASAYITALSNASMDYIIEISEDLELKEALTLPAKAASVTFRGNGGKEGGEKITLTYVGDLKLVSDLIFDKIDLQAKKLNTKTKVYEPYSSVVTLGGKDLVLRDTTATFASITGTAASVLRVEGMTEMPEMPEITVENAVKTLAKTDLYNAHLRVGTKLASTGAAVSGVKELKLERAVLLADNGSVAVTGTTTLAGGVIDGNSKINLADVISLDDQSWIYYGGNTAKDILTITGTVSGPAGACADVRVARTEDGTWMKAEDQENIGDQENMDNPAIKAGAINISVKSLEESETGYVQGAVLLNAAKATAGWFVVDGKYENGERTGCNYLTYKDGTVIKCDVNVSYNVVLGVYSDELDGYAVLGGYETLQMAFAEIDRLADADARYLVRLKDDTKGVVTKETENLKFPSKAQGVIIISQTEERSRIYFKNSISIAANLSLINIELAPQTSGTITLAKYSLELRNCSIENGKKIAAVTGSGITGTSELAVFDSEMTISGALSNVGTVALGNAVLRAEGNVNIGNVVQEAVEVEEEESGAVAVKGATLIGTAAVTRKNDIITKLVPQITINGTVTSGEGGFSVGLWEKKTVNKVTSFEELNFSAEEAAAILGTGIQLAKAVNVSSDCLSVAEDNIGSLSADDLILTKKAGYLVLVNMADCGVVLRYTADLADGADGEPAEIETWCRTFADAVTEINNLKAKREYTLELKPKAEELSMSAPTALTMPNKNYVSKLIITGGGTALYYTGNITMTSDVELQDVTFVQAAKSGKEYVPVNDLKNEYPSIVTVSTGGNCLDITGEVTFNTPITLNGGNKGVLTLDGGGRLITETNEIADEYADNRICGGITGFAEINLAGTSLKVFEYKASQNAVKAAAPGVTATTVNLNSAELYVNGEIAQGTVKITNLSVCDSELQAMKATLTNVTLAGERAKIRVLRDFTISGTLTNAAEEGILYTAQKGTSGKNLIPYLNISGAVVLQDAKENKIRVGVYQYSDGIAENAYLEGAPAQSAQLLTAKTAPAEMFMPMDGNVGGVGEYSANNPDGYVLVKSGTAVYVYYGDQVQTALYRNEELVNYYSSFADAVAQINALKDADAEYVIELLQNVGEDKPVSLTLPKTAANVTVKSGSADDAKKALYFTNNISLGTHTEFQNVELHPVTAKLAGAALNIAAGNYDLTLTDVTVEGGSIKNITGSAKQKVVLNSKELILTGNLTGAGEVDVVSSAEIKGTLNTAKLTYACDASEATVLTVGGAAAITDLEMAGGDALSPDGGNRLDAKGALTITNISHSGKNNLILYTRTAKDAPNLTVKGTIVGDGTDNSLLRLKMVTPGKGVGDYTLEYAGIQNTGVQVTLKDSKKLAVFEKASTASVEFEMDGSTDNGAPEVCVVKANKGVYFLPAALKPYTVKLESSNAPGEVTVCLDMAQATAEIKALADKTAAYTLRIGEANGQCPDTNITDKTRYSALTLPGNNLSTGYAIVGEGAGRSTLTFTGNIAAYGEVSFENISLNPVNASGTAVDCNITLSKSGSGSSLLMCNVGMTASGMEGGSVSGNSISGNNISAKATGIGSISGTKNVTQMSLQNSELTIKKGISNIDALSLEKAVLITDGAVTVNELALSGTVLWNALGKTTVGNIIGQTEAGSYLASRQTAKTLVPQFTVSGTVSDTVTFRVLTPEAQWNRRVYVDDGYNYQENQNQNPYDGVALVVAPKESADKFVAAPFVGKINTEGYDWIAYKDASNCVRNGKQCDMTVKIIKEVLDFEQGDDQTNVMYAKSFDEAVTVIDNIDDVSAYYTIQFLRPTGTEDSSKYIRTTKNGTAFGALTLPKKASLVSIKGVSYEEKTVLAYTGTLKSNCSIQFSNMTLTEGIVSGGDFKPSYSSTVNLDGSGALRFTNSSTLRNPDETNEKAKEADFVLNAVSGSRASLIFNEMDVYVKGNVNASSVILENSSLTADGTVKIVLLQNGWDGDDAAVHAEKEVNLSTIMAYPASEEGSLRISTQGKLTIGSIIGGGSVVLDTSFTKAALEKAVSQLTINGEIADGTKVKILTNIWDADTGTYRGLTKEEAVAFNMTSAVPKAYQKLATMAAAGVDDITLLCVSADDGSEAPLEKVPVTDMDGNGQYEESFHLFKYDGGLYLTTHAPAVHVDGYTEEGNQVYSADFLSWEQAVKEIDKRGSKLICYEMKLLRNAGGLSTDDQPLAALTLPENAKQIKISGLAEGETEDESGVYDFYFTGTNIVLKCDTSFENVGLMAVKKMTFTNGSTGYASVSYNMNVGNWNLTEKNMKTYGWTTSQPGTISGTAKGSFTFEAGTEWYTFPKPAQKLSGIGTVILDYPADWKTDPGEEGFENVNFYIPAGISGVTQLCIMPGVSLHCLEGDISVKNVWLNQAGMEAANIAVTGTTVMGSSWISAAYDGVGNGKCKLADIRVSDTANYIEAKQDKNGNTQMEITGTVAVLENCYYDGGSCDSAITIGLCYNNETKYAQLYDGMALVTAPKAASSWFRPQYIDPNDPEYFGMGMETEGYGLYKSGKVIKYGAVGTDMKAAEVVLYTLDSGAADAQQVQESTAFATFEEAVAEINSLARYKAGTKEFADYIIELQRDVEIGNDKNNGVYSALTLPSKAGTLTIDGCGEYTVRFSGNVTLKSNTVLRNIGMESMKAVSGQGVPVKADYALGNYTLSLDGFRPWVYDENADTYESLLGSIGGSSASGRLRIFGNTWDSSNVGENDRNPYSFEVTGISGLKSVELINGVRLIVSGNYSTAQIQFGSVEDGDEVTQDAILEVAGNITTNLLYAEDIDDAVIRKTQSGVMTVNGTVMDVDGDGIKENVEVIGNVITIQYGSDCPVGTKVLSSKYLDPAHYRVVGEYFSDESYMEYAVYQNGNTLMTGTQTQVFPIQD